jgi:hypothetical protein
MTTKNSCAKLMLAVVTAVSVNTAVSGQDVGSSRRYSKVTVRRDGAPMKTNIHDHRKQTPSGTNIHDHRNKAPGRITVPPRRNNAPGRITVPPRRAPAPSGKNIHDHRKQVPSGRRVRTRLRIFGGVGKGLGKGLGRVVGQPSRTIRKGLPVRRTILKTGTNLLP